MALAPNAQMTFTDYLVTNDGVSLHFVCANPGAGQPSDYTVLVTFAEVAALTNLASAVALVTARLQRNLRAVGVAAKLDALIGQSITL